MDATADFLPAFTDEQIAEVAMKEANKHTETIRQMCNGDFDVAKEHLADLAQAFALGACEAVSRAKDGGAVRTFQWKYGTGYLLNRLHEILDENNAAARNMNIDHSGGAFMAEDESGEDSPGYVAADGGAVIDDLAAEDMKAEALQAFNELPDNYKAAVQMFVIDGMSFKEIGKVLGIEEMNARNRCFRGIKKMRESFGK